MNVNDLLFLLFVDISTYLILPLAFLSFYICICTLNVSRLNLFLNIIYNMREKKKKKKSTTNKQQQEGRKKERKKESEESEESEERVIFSSLI